MKKLYKTLQFILSFFLFHISYFLTCASYFFMVVNAHPQDTIHPLQGDIRVHDPVMTREGNTYYIFHTGKGICPKTSKDKINWTRAGSVFSMMNLPQWQKKDILKVHI